MKVKLYLQSNFRLVTPHTRYDSMFLGMALPIPRAPLAASYSISNLKSITVVPKMVVQEERGMSFQVGSAFYRRQSALARDLGVLLAAVHSQQNGGNLRVVDVMSGCGVRAARYLHQAGADFVWANDACEELAETLRSNLSQGQTGESGAEEPWRITHEDANKLLLGCTVREDYFDLIDVDSFGSDSLCLGPAMGAVKFGGLVYATCTDGFSSGGRRPHKYAF
jgi:tRNA (guanine26-N2/guanine27-N2)-dimethyltransferase